jgi:hypothetical protein
MRRELIIDTHAHWQKDPVSLINAMDDVGVDAAVIGIPYSESVSSVLLDTIRTGKLADRLIPFASFQSDKDSSDLSDLQNRLSAFKGLRLKLEDWAYSKKYEGILTGLCTECRNLRLPIYFRTEFTQAQCIASTDPLGIETILGKFEDIPFMIEHSGPPWEDNLIGLCRKYQNVFIALGSSLGHLVQHSPGFAWNTLEKIVGWAGINKVVWSSGYPNQYSLEYLDFMKNANLPQGLVDSDYLGLTREDRMKILGGNAAKILNLQIKDAANRKAVAWTPDAEAAITECVPFFARLLARRSIERFARENDLSAITKETVNEARIKGSFKF